MTTSDPIDQALLKGLSFLDSQQLPDGGFMGGSSAIRRPFKEQYQYRTTFAPSLILGCLAENDSSPAIAIRQKLAGFLQAQKSPGWSYNYWAKDEPERGALTYPDDLDDTFCALSALTAHDTSLADESMLAGAVKILVSAETKPGGPYRTWLVATNSDPAWLDVDLAANANIAYFLSLASQPLPTLNEFLDAAIMDGQLTSPYYPSAAPLVYYLARGYSGQRHSELIKLAKNLLREAANTLDRALLLSALLRLGARPDMRKLLNAQAADGSWPAEVFCIDPSRDAKTFYHGSAALTTAFAVEALTLYKRRPNRNRANTSTVPTGSLQKRILTMARAQTVGLESSLKYAIRGHLRRIAAGSNGDEILGLSRQLNNSLLQPLPRSYEYLDGLALANLFGWSAYTIYDDFLDDEGQPLLLPVANISHRRSLELFQGQEPAFKKFVSKTFDTIDGANAWEVKNCRFPSDGKTITIQALPDFGKRDKLAERSLGHLLGPVSILNKRGFIPDSKQSLYIQGTMRHYLIAKQLNDDAHDWREDLKRGHITYVVAAILAAAKLRTGKYDIDDLISKLQTIFWYDTLPAICKTIKKHIGLGRRSLSRCQTLKPENVLTQILAEVERSVQDTIDSQKQAKSFLRHYKN